MATLTITVSPTGQAEVAVHGGRGQGCKGLTKPFIEALGKSIQDVDLPEIRLAETHNTNPQQAAAGR